MDAVGQVCDAIFAVLSHHLGLVLDQEVDRVIVGQSEALAGILQVREHVTDVVRSGLCLASLHLVFVFDDLEEACVEFDALAIEVEFHVDVFPLVHFDELFDRQLHEILVLVTFTLMHQVDGFISSDLLHYVLLFELLDFLLKQLLGLVLHIELRVFVLFG